MNGCRYGADERSLDLPICGNKSNFTLPRPPAIDQAAEGVVS